MAVASCAAIATTGWSLYVVTRYYGTPSPVAVAAVAAFDGLAYAALRLASEASSEGRSAVGARLTAVAMAAISVALNSEHSGLIHGGIVASLAFSSPGVGLLAVSELSWAGPRAAKRAQRGESPFRPASLGGWSWVMAPVRAGRSVRQQALLHIDSSSKPVPPAAGPSRHTATEKLRQRFAEMDPAEAIQIAHDAQPSLTPGELAALLIRYGVIVDAVQVALALSQRPPTTRIDRPDTARTRPDPLPPQAPRRPLSSADILSGRPDSIADAARRLIRHGITDKSEAVPLIIDALGLDLARQADSVRRAFDREIDKHEKAKPPTTGPGEQPAVEDGVGKGGGGYA
ncbi:DUF2637 domain-containing protein [Streptomyces sp. NPDC002537]